MKPKILTFFIGSYTEYPIPGFGGIGRGIYTVRLNTKTGELDVLHTEYVRNPSYLAIGEDNQFLYCHTELDAKDQPKAKAYRIREDYSLEFLNEQDINGGYPCHLVTYGSNVLVACYMTGNVLQFPLDRSGRLKKCTKDHRHHGSSINDARQEGPHAHQVAIHPNMKDIYVCDLGIDTIKAYRMQDGELMPNEQKDCKLTTGGGPRHLVFNSNASLVYVLNELTGDISVLQSNNDTFTEIHTYHALPDDYHGEAGGSAIRIHPNAKYLYAANRQLGAITIFRIEENTLKTIDFQYTRGEGVREFTISPDGQWLIACHQDSHDTVVYKIEEDGRLTEVNRTKDILSPVCLVFPD